MDPNGLRHGVPDRAGKDPARECGKYRQLHHLGILEGKKRGEKPETRHVRCAATLGLEVKTRTSNKKTVTMLSYLI